MDNWLKRYKILGAIVFCGLVSLLLFYMLIIRPAIQDAQDMRKELASKEKRLSKSKWPMQKESLEKILKEEQKRLEGKGGLKAMSEDAMKLACSTMQRRMTARGYNKISDFMGGVLNSQFQHKTWTTSLRGCEIVFGDAWSGRYRVIGDPAPYIEANTPGDWWMPVQVVRCDG